MKSSITDSQKHSSSQRKNQALKLNAGGVR
jgi:hypothetical protein